jgi:hypothetical protein
MPTQSTEAPGGADPELSLGAAAKEVAERASTLVRLELELAKLELAARAKRLAVGIGLAVAAAVVILYGVGFLFASAAAGIATVTSVWLALLIVALVLILAAGLLAFFGVRSIQRGAPPVPTQAIEEARLTTEALKHDGQRELNGV